MNQVDEFENRTAVALNELEEVGAWVVSNRPPAYILSRKFGFKIPPPHYATFRVNFIANTRWSVPLFALIIVANVWPIHSLLSYLAAVVGLCFLGGAASAFYYQFSRAKLGLTPWPQLQPNGLV